MNFYESYLRPLLFRADPERAHEFALRWLAICPPALLRAMFARRQTRRPQKAFGLEFPNPVGLAAGMDKAAVALSAWEALGFGFAEAGTITALPQPGNPKPRVFRYPAQRALVNRMGFNNPGAEEVARRLARLRSSGRWPRIPIGLNLGKSRAVSLGEATADYLTSFRRLSPFADYMVVNVSSPNTPGLRDLQHVEKLREILAALRKENPEMPLLVKIAPDLPDQEALEIGGLAAELGLAGIIATNTTLDHSALAGCPDEEGGLSGAPLAERSTALVALLAKNLPLPIVGSGGVMDAESARAKWQAGASLLQIYTGFVYRGPQLIPEILSALPAR